MGEDDDFLEVEPRTAASIPTAAQLSGGVPVPPVSLIQVLSPDDWEVFTEEWLTYHKQTSMYVSVRRYSGPGDLGLDVVAFTTGKYFEEPWDSFQCKHYGKSLEVADILGEIGKIIYHSFNKTPPFNQACRVPRRHVFVAPRGVGISAGRLLKDPARLKDEVKKNWKKKCAAKLGAAVDAALEGELREYVESFDFSIFEDRSPVELIDEHSKTVFHASRFGGGLPPREEPVDPPQKPAEHESLYLKKLFDAYTERLGTPVAAADALAGHPKLKDHYTRQRVLFYSAESLRNFARDRTPPRTFDLLQDDVYYGVIDVCDAKHEDGLSRLGETLKTAGSLDISGSALATVASIKDRQGICHQLANDDKLTWKVDSD